jgi:hypothetical protein
MDCPTLRRLSIVHREKLFNSILRVWIDILKHEPTLLYSFLVHLVYFVGQHQNRDQYIEYIDNCFTVITCRASDQTYQTLRKFKCINQKQYVTIGQLCYIINQPMIYPPSHYIKQTLLMLVGIIEEEMGFDYNYPHVIAQTHAIVNQAFCAITAPELRDELDQHVL